MADQTDLEKLAKGYIDLWKEHLKGAAQDKNTTEIMAKTIAMMNTGAAPVTVSLEQSIHIMAQLLERITSLEERVAQLEQNQPTEHNSRIRKRK